jgi:hypothetical protein
MKVIELIDSLQSLIKFQPATKDYVITTFFKKDEFLMDLDYSIAVNHEEGNKRVSLFASSEEYNQEEF